MSTWTNIPGTTFIELEEVLFLPNGPQDGELVIEWLSSGYYEPAKMYGGPDNLGHPAEGDDERTLKQVYLLANGKKFPLEKTQQEEFFNQYQEAIYKDDPDFPEQDDI